MDITHLIRKLSDVDIQKTLNFLHTTQDIQLRLRIIKVLAAYALNNRDVGVMIKYNHLYEILNEILLSKRPQRIVTALNFLCALLYVEEQDATSLGKSLALYARNMIKASGCLAEMVDLFTNCMLNRDTWKALCACLAETCRRFEPNQSYCSYLVPTGIKKCKLGDTEVWSVLQSLLHSHKLNVQLFLNSDGLTIFTREKLQHEKGMQLLSTLVQSSPEAIALLRDTSITHDLCEMLNEYGPQEKLGQWATIILFEIKKGVKEPEIEDLNNKIKWSVTSANAVRDKGADNTVDLFQNIASEILRWEGKSVLQQQNEIMVYKQSNQTHKQRFASQFLKPRPIIPARNVSLDDTFSFLMEWKNPYRSRPLKEVNRSQTFTNKHSSHVCNEPIEMQVDHTANIEDDSESINLEEFKPIFISTPKAKRFINNEPSCDAASVTFSNLPSTSHKIKNFHKSPVIKEMKQYPNKKIERKKINTTMGAKLFKAINNSCVTILNTFKKIFRAKDSNHGVNNNETNEASVTIEKMNSPNSFTEYMRRRDAIILNRNLNRKKRLESTQNVCSDTNINVCKTCDDTAALKMKSIRDDNLKKTIKKLKLGINLYGCDFKKISKALWPRDTYMTPSVLYNLYRKLILK